MECKVAKFGSSKKDNRGIDLTRMECKDCKGQTCS